MNTNIFDVSNEVVVVTGGSIGLSVYFIIFKEQPKVISIDNKVKRLRN